MAAQLSNSIFHNQPFKGFKFAPRLQYYFGRRRRLSDACCSAPAIRIQCKFQNLIRWYCQVPVLLSANTALRIQFADHRSFAAYDEVKPETRNRDMFQESRNARTEVKR